MDLSILDRYETRNMSRSELNLALSWAAAEGWNPGRHDAAAFWAADPSGFYIGLKDGWPAASASVVKYGEDYAFFGLYIVKPEDRGQGLGLALFNHIMVQAGGRTIGLDGVIDQVETYARAGFMEVFRSNRWQLEGGGETPQGLSELTELDFEAVYAYDRTCFQGPRPEFLKAWLSLPGSSALGVSGPKGLKGYGVVRPCGLGFKIGPLFADGPAEADLLYRGLLSRASGPVFLDLPEVNPHGPALVERYDPEAVFTTARMYLGQPPAWPEDKIYGITSLELG